MELVSAFIGYPQALGQVVNVEEEGLSAKFFAPGRYAAWRYKTLFTKEPATIAWMKKLNAEDILWDVGANVGIYSVYAALVTGARVLAIEPGAANYWTLCKNIEMNALDDRVTTLCAALGDEHKCADLYLKSTESGYAQNALDRPLDDSGREYKPQFRQGMLSIPADILIEQLGAPCPTAIKIDVDGFELPVLRGAAKLLANPLLRRVTLELNTARRDIMEEALALLSKAEFTNTGNYSCPMPQYRGTPVHNFHFERT